MKHTDLLEDYDRLTLAVGLAKSVLDNCAHILMDHDEAQVERRKNGLQPLDIQAGEISQSIFAALELLAHGGRRSYFWPNQVEKTEGAVA